MLATYLQQIIIVAHHAKETAYLVTSLLAGGYKVGRSYLKAALSHLAMPYMDHGILHVYYY